MYRLTSQKICESSPVLCSSGNSLWTEQI